MKMGSCSIQRMWLCHNCNTSPLLDIRAISPCLAVAVSITMCKEMYSVDGKFYWVDTFLLSSVCQKIKAKEIKMERYLLT